MKVIYNSKTGFVKRYAEWIAQEIGCSVQAYHDSTSLDGLVIFCSRVHVGKVEHLNKVKQRTNNLVVVAVGATPMAASVTIEQLWVNNNVKDIPHFYLQGGLSYERMGFLDRVIMKVFARMMKGIKTEEEAGLAEAIQRSYDISSKEYIAPVVDYLKGS